MKISSKKLAELHQYFTNEGSTAEDDVVDFLGVSDAAEAAVYVDALKRKYPDVYGGEAPEEKDTFFLFDADTNLTKQLELTKTKGSKHYFSVIEPKDLVTIRVGGEDLEVDLIKLRKKNPAERVGAHLVSTLITAAELAKG